MKKLSYILLGIFLITTVNTYSQVGINTEDIMPGLALQIDAPTPKGVLFPCIALKSTTSIEPFTSTPLNGCMIYNTTENSQLKKNFYYWDSTAKKWVSFTNQTKPNYIFQSSNNDTTTNFNSGSSWMDLFANIIENQSSTLYTKINNYNLRITETGYYRVTLNLDMKIGQSNQDRDVFGISLYLNGTQQKDRIVVRTKEFRGGTQTIGGSNVLYVYVPGGGATLSVKAFAINGASRVFFNSAKTSSINIERIR